jgi:hypothetical protein
MSGSGVTVEAGKVLAGAGDDIFVGDGSGEITTRFDVGISSARVGVCTELLHAVKTNTNKKNLSLFIQSPNIASEF